MSKSQPQKGSVGVYLDGFNFYHAVCQHRDQRVKWINYRLLAQSFCRGEETLHSVAFFTAVLTWDHQKQQRHRTFIAAQRACGVEVVESNFRKSGRGGGHEEKQTDVAIALRMFRDATEGGVTKQILITADSDQIPTVRNIKEAAPHVHIILAAPPGRGQVARDLGNHVDARQPLSFGRLFSCRLPRNVLDASGKVVATMPSCYDNSN